MTDEAGQGAPVDSGQPSGVDSPNASGTEVPAGTVDSGLGSNKSETPEGLIESRDKWKAKYRELEKAQADSASALADAEAKAAGRWEEMIQARDSANEDLRKQIEERDTQIKGYALENKERQILGTVGSGSSVSGTVLRGAYRELAREKGWDPDPKDVGKAADKRAVEFREKFPELFGGNRPGGGTPSPGAPTQKQGADRFTPDRVTLL